MKLKYYLRGVGMGIVFATIIMAISSVIHNNNLSDEYIIKEAKKLGMVMANETETEGLFGGTEDSEATEDAANSEGDTTTATEQVEGTENGPAFEITQSEEELNIGETGTVTVIDGVEYVAIEIVYGDNPRQVAERMYVHGLIDNPESFREYIGQVGYGQHLSVGVFYIPKGATYDDILSILLYGNQ